MRIPTTTIAAFAAASLGTALVDAGVVAAVARNDKSMTPQRLAIATASVATITSLSLGMIGYAMGGMKRPDSWERGLLWAGGLGLVGCAATFLTEKKATA